MKRLTLVATLLGTLTLAAPAAAQDPEPDHGLADATPAVEADSDVTGDVEPDEAYRLAAEDFDLEAVAAMVRDDKIKDAVELQKRINEDNGINNVDIDGDGYVDHVVVREVREGGQITFEFIAIPSSEPEAIDKRLVVATMDFTEAIETQKVEVIAEYPRYVEHHDVYVYHYAFYHPYWAHHHHYHHHFGAWVFSPGRAVYVFTYGPTIYPRWHVHHHHHLVTYRTRYRHHHHLRPIRPVHRSRVVRHRRAHRSHARPRTRTRTRPRTTRPRTSQPRTTQPPTRTPSYRKSATIPRTNADRAPALRAESQRPSPTPTPKVKAPRVEADRVDTSRADTSRIDAARIDAARIDARPRESRRVGVERKRPQTSSAAARARTRSLDVTRTPDVRERVTTSRKKSKKKASKRSKRSRSRSLLKRSTRSRSRSLGTKRPTRIRRR